MKLNCLWRCFQNSLKRSSGLNLKETSSEVDSVQNKAFNAFFDVTKQLNLKLIFFQISFLTKIFHEFWVTTFLSQVIPSSFSRYIRENVQGIRCTSSLNGEGWRALIKLGWMWKSWFWPWNMSHRENFFLQKMFRIQ